MAYSALVVDDHPPTVQLIKSALEGTGIAVKTAGNGAECLMCVNSERPDIIILDIMMPVMDGFQALRVLQDAAETRDIPVIMLTARSSDHDVAYGWQAGVTSYLTKPFSVDELVSLTRRVLEGTSQAEAGEAEGD